MIALDTNVVSELMRDEPHPAVRAWFNRQRRSRLCLPSVVMAELIFGVEDLPPGKRRDALQRTLYTWMDMFVHRVLPFDELAAHSYGKRAAAARRAGRPLPVADGYIAAICAAHGACVATRDVLPYQSAGVVAVNPWEEGEGADGSPREVR